MSIINGGIFADFFISREEILLQTSTVCTDGQWLRKVHVGVNIISTEIKSREFMAYVSAIAFSHCGWAADRTLSMSQEMLCHKSKFGYANLHQVTAANTGR